MLKRGHDLYALAFLTLYVYTIFAQIGYAFFPEISNFFGAYFGPQLFYKYWAFMFFSFFLSFLLYKRLNREKAISSSYIVNRTKRNYGQYIFFSIVVLLYLGLNIYFIKYRGIFGYGGGTPMGGPWFGIGFLVFQSCTFILWTLFRDKTNRIKKRILSFTAFVFCIIFFLKVVIASGTRSPIFYFFLGVAFYELSPVINAVKYRKKQILVFIFASFVLVSYLTMLRAIRLRGEEINFSSFSNYEGDNSNFEGANKGLAAVVLGQDYFLPSHTLFASMHYEIINPLEVFKSNFFNALVKFKYPFLSNTIVERVTGEKLERGAGWSYHYFIEGYNALGLFGVFYSALFWNIGMYVWTALAKSNNRNHNRAMFAMLSIIIVNTMRGQTATFIQFYWLKLLPGLGLLLLANNSKITFFKRRVNKMITHE